MGVSDVARLGFVVFNVVGLVDFITRMLRYQFLLLVMLPSNVAK